MAGTADELKVALKQARAENATLRTRNRELEVQAAVQGAMVKALRVELRPLQVVAGAMVATAKGVKSHNAADMTIDRFVATMASLAHEYEVPGLVVVCDWLCAKLRSENFFDDSAAGVDRNQGC